MPSGAPTSPCSLQQKCASGLTTTTCPAATGRQGSCRHLTTDTSVQRGRAAAAFYLKSVAPPEISLNTILASLLPFVCLQATGLMIVLLFPKVALWLPSVLS
jgi:hypothetical protein